MKRPRCWLKMPASANCLMTWAQEERTHEGRAQELTEKKLRPRVKEDEEKARRRLFVLQIVQPF